MRILEQNTFIVFIAEDIIEVGYEISFGGETGIRTLGRLPFNGFQDRRNRPLCHLSVANIIENQVSLQLNFYFFSSFRNVNTSTPSRVTKRVCSHCADKL